MINHQCEFPDPKSLSYCSGSVFQAICSGDIPGNLGLTITQAVHKYGISTSNQSVPVAWPLIRWVAENWLGKSAKTWMGHEISWVCVNVGKISLQNGNFKKANEEKPQDLGVPFFETPQIGDPRISSFILFISMMILEIQIWGITSQNWGMVEKTWI